MFLELFLQREVRSPAPTLSAPAAASGSSDLPLGGGSSSSSLLEKVLVLDWEDKGHAPTTAPPPAPPPPRDRSEVELLAPDPSPPPLPPPSSPVLGGLHQTLDTGASAFTFPPPQKRKRNSCFGLETMRLISAGSPGGLFDVGGVGSKVVM